jgi:hypothetical protein
MKVNEIVLKTKKYALYSWITMDNDDWERGKKRFLDENVTITEIRNTESGYNILIVFGDGFNKWIYLNEDCYGEYIINGVSHRYLLKEV